MFILNIDMATEWAAILTDYNNFECDAAFIQQFYELEMNINKWH